MKPFLLAFAAVLAFAQPRNVVVISHRGEHLSHPENTLVAYQAAIDLGADCFEVDVQTTADGKLVIIHDSTVDRRTNSTGKVAEMTFAQIRALDAGIKSGEQFRGIRVPTFEEALELARGKVCIDVDIKRASAADLVPAIEKYGMAERVLVYGGSEMMQGVRRLSPRIPVMPEAGSPAQLRDTLALLRPRFVAFVVRDFTGETIAIAKEAGADIYVTLLGTADNPASWRDAIARGATGIETDRVAELLAFLRAQGLHR